MHYEMMTVTPELAQRWLEGKNNRNRTISTKKVDSYAQDIILGRWKETHQNSIAFYKDGNLADGQHRLAAIVKASCPLNVMVWWGLEDDSAYGIDAHKMRSTHDQIRIAGNSDWIDKDVIACARMMMATNSSKTKVVSPQEIVSFCEPRKEVISFAHDHLPRRAASAPLRAALALAYYYEPKEKLQEWAEIMATGIGAAPLSRTVLTLRERILREENLRAGGGQAREYLLRVSMRSIQAYCAGDILTKIYEPKGRIYELPA